MGERFGFKKVATESMLEVPNDRDYVIVRQANFGKE
jgi:signal peptidase I